MEGCRGEEQEGKRGERKGGGRRREREVKEEARRVPLSHTSGQSPCRTPIRIDGDSLSGERGEREEGECIPKSRPIRIDRGLSSEEAYEDIGVREEGTFVMSG